VSLVQGARAAEQRAAYRLNSKSMSGVSRSVLITLLGLVYLFGFVRGPQSITVAVVAIVPVRFRRHNASYQSQYD